MTDQSGCGTWILASVNMFWKLILVLTFALMTTRLLQHPLTILSGCGTGTQERTYSTSGDILQQVKKTWWLCTVILKRIVPEEHKRSRHSWLVLWVVISLLLLGWGSQCFSEMRGCTNTCGHIVLFDHAETPWASINQLTCNTFQGCCICLQNMLL